MKRSRLHSRSWLLSFALAGCNSVFGIHEGKPRELGGGAGEFAGGSAGTPGRGGSAGIESAGTNQAGAGGSLEPWGGTAGWLIGAAGSRNASGGFAGSAGTAGDPQHGDPAMAGRSPSQGGSAGIPELGGASGTFDTPGAGGTSGSAGASNTAGSSSWAGNPDTGGSEPGAGGAQGAAGSSGTVQSGGSPSSAGSTGNGGGGASANLGGQNSDAGSAGADCEGCRINGACYADDASRPNNDCQKCDATSSPEEWSPRANGTPCGTNRECQSGACACAAHWANADCSTCVVFVARGGDDGLDGGTWQAAVESVQVGVDIAAARVLAGTAAVCEVWVAEGTHLAAPARDATLQLAAHVHLYGGFAGTETFREARSWTDHQTVLSGDVDGDDVTTNFDQYRSDNLYHVVTAADDTVLDGFTVRGGNAFGVVETEGGGVLVDRGANVTLRHSVFRDNAALTRGGGVSLNEAQAEIEDCVFDGNEAEYGGGLAAYLADGSVTDTTFTDNHATSAGGGLYLKRGGPSVTGCTFTWNSADVRGGGQANEESHELIHGSTFLENTAPEGGGISDHYLSGSTILSTTFTRNGATIRGGAFASLADCDPTLTNCIFWQNQSDGDGGAISATDYATPTLRNCTLYGNTAAQGGGAVYSDTDTPVSITNSILWNNQGWGGPEEIDANDSPLATTVTYSVVDGGCEVGSCTTDATGNSSADPSFMAPSTGDFGLREGSPCIDAGSNAAVPADTEDVDADGDTAEPTPDLVGAARVVDGSGDGVATVDMGALEYAPPP